TGAGSATIAGLTESSGSIAISSLTLSGNSTWSGGNWNSSAASTATINAGATLNLTTTSSHDFNFRAITNSGTVNWQGGQLRSGSGGSFTNAAGGVFNDSSSTGSAINYYTPAYGGAMSFANAGTYNKTATGTTVFQPAFTNAGTVNVNAGRLTFDGGGSTAAGSVINVASGTTLDFSGGSFTVAAPSTLALAGTLSISGGTTTLNAGAYTVPDLSLTGGTLTGAGTMAVAAFAQSSGVMDLTAFTLTGSATWTSGNWNTSSATTATIASGATLTLAGTNVKDFNRRVVTNSGTVEWQGGQLRSGNGGGFVNAAGGVFNDSSSTGSATNYFTPAYGGAMSFTNAGTYNKTGTGTTVFQPSFANTGTVNVNAGKLTLDGGGSTAAGSVLNLASGTTLDFSGGTMTLAAAGNLAFTAGSSATVTGGTTTLNSGGFSPPALTVTNGTFHAADAAATSTIPALTLSGGTLSAAGTLATTALTQTGGSLAAATVNLTGNASWTSGNWNTSAASTGTIASGVTLTVSSTNVHDFNFRTVTNQGTVNWSGGQLRSGNGGGFINAAGATFSDSATTTTFFNAAYGGSASFANSGTYTKSGNATTYFQSPFANTGTVNVNAGKLELDNGGSTATGSSLNVANGATLEFGGGTFTFAASTTLSATGNINVTGGTTTFTTGNFALPSLSLTGGTIDGAGSITTPSFTQSGGALDLSSLVFTSSALWNSGNWNSSSATTATINSGATLTLATAGVHDFNRRTITNHGTLNWQAGQFRSGSGGGFVNAAGAVVNDTASSYFNAAYGGTASFANQGTYNKSAAGTTTFQSPLVNSGTFNVTAGQLSLDGGGSASAGSVLNLASGTTLAFASGTFVFAAPSTLVADGPLTTTGGTPTFNGGTYTLPTLTLTGGTIDGNGTLNVATYSQSGGALAVANLNLTGTVAWTSGNWNGPAGSTATIASGSTLNLTNTNAHDFDARTITNNGILNWTLGYLRSGHGGSFVNTAGATFNDGNANGYSFHDGFGGGASFVNQGTYSRNATGTTYFDVAFNNTGTVNLQQGDLQLRAGGTMSATSVVNASANTNLYFTNDYTLAAGAQLAGAGAFTQTGGTLTFANLKAPAFNWSSGNWNGAGTSAIDAATVLNLVSGNSKDFNNRTLTNHGTVNWQLGYIRSGSGGSFTNATGATFNDLQGSGYSIHNPFGGSFVFTNNGTYNRNATGTTSYLDTTFDNHGAVNVVAGDLRIRAGGTMSSTGTINAASGANVFFDASYAINNGSSLTGAGNFWLTSGTMTLTGSIGVGTFNQTGGSLVGNSTLTGTFNWSAGNWNAPSAGFTTTIGTGATLNLNGGSSKDFDFRSVVNQGTVNWNLGYLRGGHASSFTNAAGATFNDLNASSYTFHDAYGGGTTFVNQGTYNRSVGGTTYFDAPFDNNGTINLTGGDLQLRAGGTMGAKSVLNGATGTNSYLTNNYTILDGAKFVGAGNFMQTGGTLTLNGNLLATAFNWHAGNWNATAAATTTIDSTTVLNLVSGNSKDFDFRSITNNGTVNWQLGYLRAGHGSVFTNAAGATFNDQNGSSYTVHNPFGGTFAFVNNGTYNRNVGGTTGFDTTFDNHGTINLQQGDLQLRAGGTMGASSVVNATTGTSLFITNSYTLLAGSQFLGAGGFTQTGGTLTFTNLKASAFNWSGGNWNGAGTSTVDPGTIVNLVSGNNKDFDARTVVNQGTVNWQLGYLRGGHGSTFTNAAGATFNDQNASSYTFHDGFGSGTSFTNNGTYNRSVGGTTFFDAPFNNNGTLNLTGGDLQIRQGGTMSATSVVNASAGTNLHITNNYTLVAGSQFLGAGGFIQTGGTLTVDLLKASAFTWSSGNWNGAGTSTIDVGTVLNLSSGNTKDFESRTIVNNGTVTWTAGYLRSGNGGSFTNAAGATFNDQNASGYTIHNPFGGTFTITNAGSYVRTGGGTTQIQVPFTNTGTVEVKGGSLVFTGTFTNTNGSILASGGNLSFPSGLNLGTGQLGGSGTITASTVTAGGLVTPGASPGTLTIAGNLNLLSTSTLIFEIGGLNQGVSYDWLNVTGTAAVAGTLQLTLVNGFNGTLANTETYTIISAAARTGTFANIPTTGLRLSTTDGFGSFQVNFTSTAVTLSNFVAIPEPSTYALLALGGLVLIFAARRRK
ncbi:MAG: PEP-CTERM sorting domain-containing protein, partial [Verrucomicrobia bacterium]|nr:PEP-CTERM sorting domain-containing protein [Verrucomicrobiota bacterium]